MLTLPNVMLIFSAALFGFGLLFAIAGGLILIFRVSSNEVKALAIQTTRLAQKGMAEDVSGLVGNASSIIDGLNQLTRTAAGIGVFMIIVGMVLMAAAVFILYQLLPVTV